MPLTLAELEDIRGSEFAEDVSIDMNLMVTWSESEARDYFASGGVTLPASAHAVDVSEAAAPSSEGPDAALVDLLEEIGLTDLSGPLAGKSMAFLTSVLAIDPITKSTPSDGRANLLAELKASGVTSLAHRQKLATALSKAAKQALEPSAPGLASAAAPKPPAATAAKPVAAAMPSSSSALPRPGAAAAARRKKVGPLPPYQRLSAETLKRTAGQNLKGEWYGLELPTGLKQLESEAWGARWLTKTFHATGVLAASDRVERITKFAYLDLQGMDAQGGAGEKAIVSVEYADKSNGMHTDLFVKCPWAYSGDHGERWRTMLSVVFGDGDGLELSTYTLLEGLLPMRSTQQRRRPLRSRPPPIQSTRNRPLLTTRSTGPFPIPLTETHAILGLPACSPDALLCRHLARVVQLLFDHRVRALFAEERRHRCDDAH